MNPLVRRVNLDLANEREEKHQPNPTIGFVILWNKNSRFCQADGQLRSKASSPISVGLSSVFAYYWKIGNEVFRLSFKKRVSVIGHRFEVNELVVLSPCVSCHVITTTVSFPIAFYTLPPDDQELVRLSWT